MLLLVSIIIFIGLELMPGDPITYRFPAERLSNLSANELDELREIYGLNQSIIIRYAKWLFNILQGDLGISIATSAPIAGLLKSRLSATLELVGAALLISTIFGIILGFISAVKKKHNYRLWKCCHWNNGSFHSSVFPRFGIYQDLRY